MTSPTLPYAIFSPFAGTHSLTQSKPAKELKMPTHNQRTQADVILSAYVQRIINNHFNLYLFAKTK